jgi:hypothetical protein
MVQLNVISTHTHTHTLKIRVSVSLRVSKCVHEREPVYLYVIERKRGKEREGGRGVSLQLTI